MRYGFIGHIVILNLRFARNRSPVGAVADYLPEESLARLLLCSQMGETTNLVGLLHKQRGDRLSRYVSFKPIATRDCGVTGRELARHTEVSLRFCNGSC